MTVTTNEFGQQNLFAKEPQMYVDKTEAERYGYETYAERAEKLNGRVAMLGFIAAVVSYATTGSLFFFGAFGIWWKTPFLKFLLTMLLVVPFWLVLQEYSSLLYSCLPFKIQKGVWLDTKIIKPTVILQSMRTPVVTIANFTLH